MGLEPEDILRPSAALGAFSDSLLSGRRTAMLGDSTDPLAGRLAAACGRRVHVFDRDAKRAAAAIVQTRGAHTDVSYAPLDDAPESRGGAFDAVVIPDLTSFPDAPAMLEIASSLLSGRGILILASPNPEHSDRDTIGYYQLYDLVAERFEHVRMLGQAPFAGFTVADFAAAGEPAVTIDASLVSGPEEPTWFVVVASRAQVEVEPYLLVQVPAGSSPPQEVDTAAIAEARLRETLLSTELEKLRDKEREVAQRVGERDGTVAKLSSKLSDVSGELDRERARWRADRDESQKMRDTLTRRLQAAERELGRAKTDREAAIAEVEEANQKELDALLERLGEMEEAAERPAVPEVRAPEVRGPEPADVRGGLDARGYEFQIAQLKAALATARGERDDARDVAKRVPLLEQQLAKVTGERDELLRTRGDGSAAGEPDDHGREIAELEERLRERGTVVEQLRAELREGERIGRELVAKLTEADVAGPENGDGREAEALRGQIESLVARCSRYEADLQAATWKISTLSTELAENQSETPDQIKLEDALRQAHEDLAALKRELEKRG